MQYILLQCNQTSVMVSQWSLRTPPPDAPCGVRVRDSGLQDGAGRLIEGVRPAAQGFCPPELRDDYHGRKSRLFGLRVESQAEAGRRNCTRLRNTEVRNAQV